MNQDILHLKRDVFDHCRGQLDERTLELQSLLKDYQEAANSDAKSSMGDKYETNRAMMHLEKEKVSTSLNEVFKQKKALNQIKPEKVTSVVEMGSLIKTDKGYFFLSISLGMIRVNGKSIICLSPVAPLGKLFMGMRVGASVSFKTIEYSILDCT